MIDQETVLILGAGASKPYGFSDGRGLRDKAMRLLANMNLERREQTLRETLMESFGTRHMEKDAEILYNELQDSQETTIDEFLTKQRSSTTHMIKRLIAAILLDEEKNHNIGEHRRTRDWYSELIVRMLKPYNKIRDNKLTIVTFNYDRSLEYSILRTLSKQSVEFLQDFVNNIDILHVHGSLGYLPSYHNAVTAQSVDYGSSHTNIQDIAHAAEGIKVIGEIRDDTYADAEFEKANLKLMNAKNIFFLGYAYHWINMMKLNIKEIPIGAYIGGTALGEPTTRIRNNFSRCRQRGDIGRIMDSLMDTDCLNYLKNNHRMQIFIDNG